jgi:hypothetical protein
VRLLIPLPDLSRYAGKMGQFRHVRSTTGSRILQISKGPAQRILFGAVAVIHTTDCSHRLDGHAVPNLWIAKFAIQTNRDEFQKEGVLVAGSLQITCVSC